jgi:hypothetical protein
MHGALPSGLIQLVQPVAGQIKLFWITKTEQHRRRIMLLTTGNKDSASNAGKKKGTTDRQMSVLCSAVTTDLMFLRKKMLPVAPAVATQGRQIPLLKQ